MGIRLGELCSIQLSDVDLYEGYITVYGKGRKQWYVPIGKDLKKILWKYIKQRRRLGKNGDQTLIISRTGVVMTPHGIQIIPRKGRLFILSIGFLRIYSWEVSNLFGVETDGVGDYILFINTGECRTIAVG